MFTQLKVKIVEVEVGLELLIPGYSGTFLKGWVMVQTRAEITTTTPHHTDRHFCPLMLSQKLLRRTPLS